MTRISRWIENRWPLWSSEARMSNWRKLSGCDSRSRTEKVRLRQKLEQRRAGAARGNPRSPCTSGHVEQRMTLCRRYINSTGDFDQN